MISIETWQGEGVLGRPVLVTGGGGFLGGAIAAMLVNAGATVRSLARNHYAALEKLGVTQIQGDVADSRVVDRAVAGCGAVFHVAAKAGVWGSYERYFQANVEGTRHILAACKRHAVSRLIYTSSPSVVFDGRDQEGIDETVSNPQHFLAHYPRTKAMAESVVLDGNDDRLTTVSLRPHLIWGPGDNHLVPRLIARAKAGKLRLVGGGTNLVDSVYIDNAAEAHLLAAAKLVPGSAIAGKAYFITNDEPLPMGQLINGILAAAGLPPVTRTISGRAAYAAGVLFEGVYKLLGRRDEPLMTRFVARQLQTAHWFDISAAKRDLGYSPRVSIREGLAKLKASFA